MAGRRDSDKETLVSQEEVEHDPNSGGSTPSCSSSNSLKDATVNQESSVNLTVNDILSSRQSSRHVSGASSRVSSFNDLPHQAANTGRSGQEAGTYRELLVPGEPPPEVISRETWEANYREAAIFLEEGENNDKFLHHPRDREALPAYLLVHSQWFNIMDLVASLIVLALGFFEAPCEKSICGMVPVPVHGSVELCTLVLISAQLFLKTRWIGWKSFFRHKRTVVKASTLLIMVIEAVVVLCRQTNHFRVTRALRPLFLIDNHYCGGVRRFIRQIMQCLPLYIDMMGLLLFIMVIYSVFGFYLFGPSDSEAGSPYFKSMMDSFISLFVLLTTANFPDVMMPSYAKTRWSAFFFISYLSINLYFLMNLLLAVVYDTFTTLEVTKFKKLFLHRRKASQHAFKLLVTKEAPNSLYYDHFHGLMTYYHPSNSPVDSWLMFKLLARSGQESMHQEEFYDIYDAVRYRWRVDEVKDPYYFKCKQPFAKITSLINKLVTSWAFEYGMYILITANGLLVVAQTLLLERKSDEQVIYAAWVSYIFVALYSIEVILKMTGIGIRGYFRSYWDIFDFVCTLLSIASIVITALHINYLYSITLIRLLRLLRLFRMKKRFRDVFGTAIILLPRLGSAVIVLLLMYYFFGIIGIELFSDYELKDCCKNTTVEAYYNFADNNSGIGYYYLNNFESLPIAGFTLFELTVVNNWFIIMEGFAAVSNDWSRIYFMTFYTFTMVVMTIIVAFILEAFLFRIQYKQKMNKTEEIKKLSVTVKVTKEELFELDQINTIAGRPSFKELIDEYFKFDEVDEHGVEFCGSKRRTKEELQKLMYQEDTKTWMEEAKREEEIRAEEFQRAVASNRNSDVVENDGVEFLNPSNPENQPKLVFRSDSDNCLA